MKTILVISDKEQTKVFFNQYFGKQFNITHDSSIEQGVTTNRKLFFDCIFVDLICFKLDTPHLPLSKDIFEQRFWPLQKYFPSAKKIIMAERKMIQDCILTVKLGIDNYINYPLIADEIQYVIDLSYENLKNKAVAEHFKSKISNATAQFQFSYKSKALEEIYDQVQSVAQTKSTVLITGESGTGKSVLAKKIHDLSNRHNKNFISVHCGAISEGLIESELFGHEKGAFTGAIKRKLGKFELAMGGTIFLDEIGTISKSAQIKLLQVLQERFIQRVGGEENINVDIRIIAATNTDLKKAVENNLFREDLYFRLNVFPIEIPPLRKRPEDINDLSNDILNRLNKTYGKNIDQISAPIKHVLNNYTWPGNIRELENVIERAYVLEKTHILTADNFPLTVFNNKDQPKSIITLFPSLNLNDARRLTLDTFERNYIQELLKTSKGDLKKASEVSGVTIRQLHKFISKHHINRKEFFLSENQNWQVTLPSVKIKEQKLHQSEEHFVHKK